MNFMAICRSSGTAFLRRKLVFENGRKSQLRIFEIHLTHDNSGERLYFSWVLIGLIWVDYESKEEGKDQ